MALTMSCAGLILSGLTGWWWVWPVWVVAGVVADRLLLAPDDDDEDLDD